MSEQELQPEEPVTPKVIYGSGRAPVTPEEYEHIKATFPKLKFNDEDMTFVSGKGNTCSAALLRQFKPIPPGGNEISQAGTEMVKLQAQDKYEKYLTALSQGDRISAACRRARIQYGAIKKRRSVDAEFAVREREAEQFAAEPVENSLWDAAINGNVPAAVKWLEKRAPDRWPSDKTIIETKTTLELDTGDRINNIIALMAKLQQRAELQGEVIDVQAIEPNQLIPGDEE